MARQQAVSCWFEGDYVAAAGLAVKQDEVRPATGGFVPPLEPASPTHAEAVDPLGLGLGTPGSAPAANGTDPTVASLVARGTTG